jgi:hypothetical protein
MLDFVRSFFCIYGDDDVNFVLYSTYLLYYIYLFMCVEPFLYAWNETNLITVNDLFNVLLNLVCRYFIENFFLLAVLELELSLHLEPLHRPFFVKGFLEIGAHKLFAQAACEL